MNSINLEKIFIPLEKRQETLDELRQVLQNDSTVSKFVTRKFIEVNDLSNGQYSVNKNVGF